ncbi:hypothetical protein [Streptomyces sp. A5-4]
MSNTTPVDQDANATTAELLARAAQDRQAQQAAEAAGKNPPEVR